MMTPKLKRKIQTIPITSYPPGAKVIVNGFWKGNSPLNLDLSKKDTNIIRIEKQGYHPFIINIAPKLSDDRMLLSILGNTIFGFLGMSLGAISGFSYAGLFSDYDLFWDPVPASVYIGMIAGGLLGFGFPFHKDYKSGAIHDLYPKQLNITLTKIGAKPQPNIIFITSEQFQNIKWIRIKCADYEKKEIINID